MPDHRTCKLYSTAALIAIVPPAMRVKVRSNGVG
jgi:hypothetical protein